MYAAHMRRISSAPEFTHAINIPDEETFNCQLHNFNRRQRRFHASPPSVYGVPINLHRLYVSVLKHGGYNKVTEQKKWSKIFKELALPKGCVNFTIALRRVYSQFLLAYQNDSNPHLMSQSLWTPIEDDYHDLSNPQSVDKILGIVIAHPVPPHYGMHRSATHIGVNLKDLIHNRPSNDSYHTHFPHTIDLDDIHTLPHPDTAFEMRQLYVLETAEKSLLSGLPNEIDLSLNSILFLSAVVHTSAATPLRLSHTRNLLPLVLASVGIYEDGPSSLRSLHETWSKTSSLDFDKFWNEMVDESISTCLGCDTFLLQEHSEPVVYDYATGGCHLINCEPPNGATDKYPSQLPDDACLSRVLIVATLLVNLVTPPSNTGAPLPDEDDEELEQAVVFSAVSRQHLSRNGGRDTRGRSRSLSIHVPPMSTSRDNARHISSIPAAIRFAFLCANAKHSSALKQLGLQLISSGLRYPLDPRQGRSLCSSLTPTNLHFNAFTGLELVSVKFLSHCLLESSDRYEIVTGLNLLTNLLKVPDGVNVESLFVGLPHCIWVRLIQMLCLPDLGLVCAALEALYCATGMGLLACSRFWRALATCDQTMSQRAPDTVFAVRHASIHLCPLLALLSLEGQSMGTGSLHRIKVMQRHATPTVQPIVSVPYYTPQAISIQPSQRQIGLYPRPPPYPHQNAFSLRSAHQEREVVPRPVVYGVAPSHPQRSTTSLVSLLCNSSSLHRSLPQHQQVTQMPVTQALSPTTPRVVSAGVPSPGALVKPEASKLSELTDRLQMPPPTMPPPSALRRAAASRLSRSPESPLSQQHMGRSVNGSPPTLNGASSEINSSSPPTLTPIPMGNNCRSGEQRISPSKSLLEEVLNDVSTKSQFSSILVNGTSNHNHQQSISPGSNGIRKDLIISKSKLYKLVNGDSGELPVKRLRFSSTHEDSSKQSNEDEDFKVKPLCNGILHKEDEDANIMIDENLLNKENSDDKNKCWASGDPGTPTKRVRPKLEKGDVNAAEANEKMLTNFTHRLRFHRRGRFHFAQRRTKNVALRNRIAPPPMELLKRVSAELTEANRRAEEEALSKANALVPIQPSLPYVCEWDACLQEFTSTKQVSCHVYTVHLNNTHNGQKVPGRRCCQWAECQSPYVPRAHYALLGHVLDTHCSSGELSARRTVRRTIKNGPPPVYPPQHFPKDQSGLSIIKEVETRRLQSDLWIAQMGSIGGPQRGFRGGPGSVPPREGPVTKHLRVTAALILRNLATNVPEARKWLVSETPLLCEIAMGTCPGSSSLRTNDAGRIIAQCLAICEDRASLDEISHHFQSRPFRLNNHSVDLDA